VRREVEWIRIRDEKREFGSAVTQDTGNSWDDQILEEEKGERSAGFSCVL
jgi:hypothetical protein